jgi:hypothetical protein
MSIRHKEIVSVPGSPFANCQLDRQQYAKVLTSIVSTYSDGFVLAINNKWGTGKTTFVKMWEQDLKDKDYQTVYFNAWENDFENNPLTALMGELKTLTKKATEPEFKTVLKRAATLSKHLAPTIIKAIADKYVDTQGIKEAIENITKGVSDIFENEVNEYAEKKKGITDFRTSLSKFIADTNEGKPLIFIVDELDRCRPDYAVAILEQIKHFFSVPNIVFVLSIDKEQLGNAVRGVYGSEQIDAEEYLRRFIDLEYSIPEPEAEKYCNYLYNYFGFDEFFKSDFRKKHSELNYDNTEFIKISKILFKNSTISLRQQEKIFAHARLVLRSFLENSYVIPSLFLLLIYIKIINNALYEKIRLKELSIKELQEEFFNIIKFNNTEEEEREIMFLEAYLVHYYNNYKSTYYNRNKLYDREDLTAKNKLLITSVTDKSPEQREFLGILENMSGRRNGGDLNVGYLLNKIDLTEAIKF